MHFQHAIGALRPNHGVMERIHGDQSCASGSETGGIIARLQSTGSENAGTIHPIKRHRSSRAIVFWPRRRGSVTRVSMLIGTTLRGLVKARRAHMCVIQGAILTTLLLLTSHALDTPKDKKERHEGGKELTLSAEPTSSREKVETVRVARLVKDEHGNVSSNSLPPSPSPDGEWHTQIEAILTKDAEVRSDREQVHVLTYSDRNSKGLCLSLASADSHGFKPTVLGIEGSTFDHVADPKLKKLYGMQEFFNNPHLSSRVGIDEDSILLFADAMDVLYVGPLREAFDAFNDLTRNEKRDTIVVSAERNCWPYMLSEQELIPGGRQVCEGYPHGNSSYRYLNSGAYMGRFKPLKAFLNAAYSRINSTGDDQRAFHELYSKQVRHGRDDAYEIKLDHQSRLFQTGWSTHLGTTSHSIPESSGAYFDVGSGRILNTETGTRPFLVHFNGGKVALEPIARSILGRGNFTLEASSMRECGQN